MTYQSSIPGIGVINVDPAEYTTMDMLNQFLTGVTNIEQIFQKKTGLSARDYDDVLKQIQNLQILAKQGLTTKISSPRSNINQTTTYLNFQMASSLNDIMNSLSLVGIPPANSSSMTDAEKLNALQLWQAQPSLGINVQSYFDKATSIYEFSVPTTDATTGITSNLLVKAFPYDSLQTALELQYVSYANQLISTKLTNLQTSLNVSNQIVGTLTQIQNFVNQITVNPKQPSFSFPPTQDPSIQAGSEFNLFSNQVLNQNVGNAQTTLFNYLTSPSNTSNALVTALNNLWTSTNPTDAAAQQTLQNIVNAYNNSLTNINNAVNAYNKPINSNPFNHQTKIQTSNTPITFPLTATTDSGIGSAFFQDYGVHQGSVNMDAGNLMLQIFQQIPSLFQAALDDYHANPANQQLVVPMFSYINSYTGGENDPRPGEFRDAYEAYASAYFSQLFPSTTFMNALQAASTLKALKSTLLIEIQQIVAADPSPSAAASYPGSFANTIFKVAQDISASFLGTQTAYSALQKFILDGQQLGTQSLSTSQAQTPIQNDITNATNAAETTAQNQQESVKNYMFVYQQFYKATASMLKTLAEIFAKISQGFS